MSPSWTDIGTFSVLAAAAVVGFVQASEARRLRLARIRPFVVLDFDVDYQEEVYYLVLRNYGSTLARDIEISVDPPLESALHADVGQLDRLRAWGRSIKSLAPGVERRALFDADFLRPLDEPANAYTTWIHYWDDGHIREFNDEVTLDIATARGLGRLQRGKTTEDVHKMLERIAQGLERPR